MNAARYTIEVIDVLPAGEDIGDAASRALLERMAARMERQMLEAMVGGAAATAPPPPASRRTFGAVIDLEMATT